MFAKTAAQGPRRAKTRWVVATLVGTLGVVAAGFGITTMSRRPGHHVDETIFAVAPARTAHEAGGAAPRVKRAVVAVDAGS